MLCIDLFCGLGGWAEGFLAEGYRVIGFDIERRPYPGELVLQDVMTLDGSQFRNATVIVASPPCQAYSYRAMPWKRAKALPPPSNDLFDACFRIQREAIAATGYDCPACYARHSSRPCARCEGTAWLTRYIPLVVENVCGAQRWVGKSVWHHGSFHLWGDIPALMPWRRPRDGRKLAGNNSPRMWSERRISRLCDARKSKGDDFYMASSGSAARKQASAEIAKIPFDLANHIARVYKPSGADARDQFANLRTTEILAEPSK